MSDQSFENPCLGRLITGARPRGSIHLGELTGAVESWVHLQDHYECIFIIADAEMQDPAGDLHSTEIQNIYEMLADWLAAGISPNYSIITLQSAIPERLQLAKLLKNAIDSSIWQQVEANAQSAEIGEAIELLLFKADTVPFIAGQSKSSLAAAQKLGSSFNQEYGDVFPILKPQRLPGRHLLGVDGRPMQHSSGNLILLKEFDEETGQKISSTPVDTLVMYTTRFDHDQSRANAVIEDFYAGHLSEANLRKHVTVLVNDYLHSVRVKRDKWIANPGELEAILQVGARRARAAALETLVDVTGKLR